MISRSGYLPVTMARCYVIFFKKNPLTYCPIWDKTLFLLLNKKNSGSAKPKALYLRFNRICQFNRRMLYHKQNNSGLDQLEREANNEFGLLAELGPELFGGAHLVEMSQTVRQRLRHFERLQRVNMIIGATAALWFIGAMVALQMNHSLLAQVGIFLMLLAIVGFIAGVIFLKAKFESRGELESTLDVIEEELRRRSARQGSGARKR